MCDIAQTVYPKSLLWHFLWRNSVCTLLNFHYYFVADTGYPEEFIINFYFTLFARLLARCEPPWWNHHISHLTIRNRVCYPWKNHPIDWLRLAIAIVQVQRLLTTRSLGQNLWRRKHILGRISTPTPSLYPPITYVGTRRMFRYVWCHMLSRRSIPCGPRSHTFARTHSES